MLKKSPGQSAIETALTLPILLILVMGIVTIGWWMNVQQVATNAAAQAAAIGATTNDNCQIIGAAQSAMRNIAKNINSVKVGIDPKAAADRKPGVLMTVQVSYPIGFGLGFITSTNKFSTVVANAVARMDYYSDTGDAKIPSDPVCAGS